MYRDEWNVSGMVYKYVRRCVWWRGGDKPYREGNGDDIKGLIGVCVCGRGEGWEREDRDKKIQC